ncbi:hypothetical protein [Corynebacterium freiburgense]|uniref:hypothetical protein n=1 Tax=Corynebacterium freiburgense TaxID=556548 RepID=UPI0004215CFD|nr:hypothetical protein [Corynebacterium freiburgense]WJZ01984.1 hypothetical protein CFREI_03405 [Corynebacterium freiburgense]
MEDFLRRIELQYPLATSACEPRVLARRIVALLARVADDLQDYHPQLIAAIEEARDGFDGLIIPRQVPFGTMSLELINALCATAVDWDVTEFEQGRADFTYSLYRWCKSFPENYSRSNLKHLREHSKLGSWLHSTISVLDLQRNVDTLLAFDGTRELLAEYLRSTAHDRERYKGSVPGLASLYQNRIANLAAPELWEFAPEAMERILRFDAPLELAAALRFGLAAELGWQGLERCIERLSDSEGDIPQLCESWPALAVISHNEAEFVSGDAVLHHVDYSFAFWDIASLRMVGDDVAVCMSYDSVFLAGLLDGGELEEVSGGFHNAERYSFPFGDSRLTGVGILRSGEQREPAVWHAGGQVLVNGDIAYIPLEGNGFAVWAIREGFRAENLGRSATLQEVLECLGVYSWVKNAVGEAFNWPNVRFRPNHSTVIPIAFETAPSPMGRVGDRHINIVFKTDSGTTIVSPFGVFHSAYDVCAVLARPGGGFWLTNGSELFDAAADVPLMKSFNAHGEAMYMSSNLPLAGWHHMRPRNEGASEKLRHCTAEQAARLLSALVPEPGRKVGSVMQPGKQWWRYGDNTVEFTTSMNTNSDSQVLRVINEQFGAMPQELAIAIVHTAADIAALAQRFESLRGGTGNAADFVEVCSFPELRDISNDLIGYLYGADTGQFSGDQVRIALETLARVLHHPSEIDDSLFFAPIFYFIGRERLLLSLLSAPLLRREIVFELAGFLRAVTNAGVLSGGLAHVVVPLHDLQAPSVIGDCIVLESQHLSAQVLAPSVAVEAQEVLEEFGLPRAEFLAGLEALEERKEPDFEKLEKEIEMLSAGTCWTPAAARWLLGGKPLNGELRNIAIAQLGERPFIDYAEILVELIDSENPDQSIQYGRRIEFCINAWRSKFGEPQLHLSDYEYAELLRFFSAKTCAQLWKQIEVDEISAQFIGALLLLLSWRRTDDPERAFIARQLREVQRHIHKQNYEFPEDFNLGFDEVIADNSLLDLDALTLEMLRKGVLNLALLEASRPYGSPSGHPYDPLVSAPTVVEAVAHDLQVGIDAARYYLQLLALTDPNDENICYWNGWQPGYLAVLARELDAYLAPLARPDARRKWGIPGPWLESHDHYVGMEQHKAKLYSLLAGQDVQPIIPGCPPPMPMGQLFLLAWERAKR